MSLPKMLFLSLLLLCALGTSAQRHLPDCDIEVKVEINQSTSGKSDGSVKETLTKGDKKHAKFVFCEMPSGTVLNENTFSKPELSGLKKGSYLLIVSIRGCSKKIDFSIE